MIFIPFPLKRKTPQTIYQIYQKFPFFSFQKKTPKTYITYTLKHGFYQDQSGSDTTESKHERI